MKRSNIIGLSNSSGSGSLRNPIDEENSSEENNSRINAMFSDKLINYKRNEGDS